MAVFCLIDDQLEERRVRSRGLAPKLSDPEVLTIEIVVGEFLGLDTDKGIYLFFRRHCREWFPTLGEVHRTTFCRRAANLWKIKERLWQEFLSLAPHDHTFAICDSMPLPACLFARAYRCKRFRGEAAVGKDTLLEQTFYGFRVARKGLLARGDHPLLLGGPNLYAHELRVLPELAQGTSGLLIGDPNYHSPKTGQGSWRARVWSFWPRTPPRSETPLPKGAPSSAGFATG